MGQSKSVEKNKSEVNESKRICNLASIVNGIREPDTLDYEFLSNKTSL